MYVHSQSGTAPVLVTVPHDGWIKIDGGAVRDRPGPRDLGTLPLAMRLAEELGAIDLRPTVVWTSLHRRHADANRYPHDQPFAEGFEGAYAGFHDEMDRHLDRLLVTHQTVVHLDVHGFTSPVPWDIVFGTQDHRTSPRGTDVRFAAAMNRRFSASIARPYRVAFSPDESLGIGRRYSGGWIVGRCGRTWAHRGVDSIQCEFNRHLRDPNVTNGLARDLARVLAGLV